MKTYQGRYTPKNPIKYKGDYRNVIYRSSWELKFMKYCDTRDSVIEWGSEEIVVPYRSPLDGKIHRYFVDFYVKVKDKTGIINKYLVEVKPKKQVSPPVNKSRVTKRYLMEVAEYVKNQAKWEAAENYCLDRQMKFLIITEDHLGIK